MRRQRQIIWDEDDDASAVDEVDSNVNSNVTLFEVDVIYDNY